MIEFNLLPDVKIAFIKAERQKRLVISVSAIASIAAIALFLLLFSFVHVVQKKSMDDLTVDINKRSKELVQTPNLNKMLTVQNQLSVLDQLHGGKIVSSRLFGYLQKVTPADVTMSQLKVDYAASTMEITGDAKSLAAVYTFADSLKYTTFSTTGDSGDKTPAFKDVVLSNVSLSEKAGPQYTFTLNFDPALFTQDKNITLFVQKKSATRLDSTAPDSVFQKSEGQ